MIIKNCKTVEEYKRVEVEIIERWIDFNFMPNAIVKWEIVNGKEAYEVYGTTKALKIYDVSGSSCLIDLLEVY